MPVSLKKKIKFSSKYFSEEKEAISWKISLLTQLKTDIKIITNFELLAKVQYVKIDVQFSEIRTVRNDMNLNTVIRYGKKYQNY